MWTVRPEICRNASSKRPGCPWGEPSQKRGRPSVPMPAGRQTGAGLPPLGLEGRQFGADRPRKCRMVAEPGQTVHFEVC
jgi:hypothetical protein